MINLWLFGPPRLERNGQPIEINLRKALALFIYLCVTRQPHSRDALATLFWPEKDQQTARANLRRTLYDLGKLLGEQLLAVGPEMVALQPETRVWIDSEHFQAALVGRLPARAAAPMLDAACLLPLVEAADHYTNDFLDGFTLPDAPAFDDWQFFQREELRRTFAALLQHLVLTYRRSGKYDEAIRYARRWLALDQLDEAVHRHLMELYALAGQPAAAQRQYDECVRILTAELDAPPEDETTALYEAIRTRRFPPPDQVTGTSAAQPPLVAAGHPVTRPPNHQLPAQTTPFVGRQQELAELRERLYDPACRLLTLVGPGGMGKTRLALAAAQAIAASESDDLDADASQPIVRSHQAKLGASDNPKSKIQNSKFVDGVYFVPLQPVGAPSGLIPAIADALGFQFYSGAPAQAQLNSFLGEKELLLVLDNFEHLLAGAHLVADLLAAAPGVTLLITSREALKLHEEWFHPLAGMRLPPSPRVAPPAQASEEAKPVVFYDAVQLFNQTARRAVAGFAPEAQEEQIAPICRPGAGVPRGI
ncbi:MAG TPA: BTAD domain-containing putative transcriptional regulator [Caldilineaceae bacterium]|nr:BTAD domain-containing putative transcriptional regulator [Caldilineaceae bacterium]